MAPQCLEFMVLLLLHALCTVLRKRRRFVGVLTMMAGLVSGVAAASPLGGPPKEFQVKAVFLYNFAQFVEWPASAFEGPESPLVIGVLGLDPFGSFLDETVQGERVNGRPLVVRRYRSVSEIDRCHILFISGSESADAAKVAATMKERGVLTVCDWEATNWEGSMVRFVMDRGRVRLRINLESAKEAGLNISSKLLRSAEAVTQSGSIR